MPRKKTAQDIARETQLAMVVAIQKKVMERIAGDPTAVPRVSEMKFLQDVIKLEQEREQGEALVSYLAEMTTEELEDYHDRLNRSLQEGEGLN